MKNIPTTICWEDNHLLKLVDNKRIDPNLKALNFANMPKITDSGLLIFLEKINRPEKTQFGRLQPKGRDDREVRKKISRNLDF